MMNMYPVIHIRRGDEAIERQSECRVLFFSCVTPGHTFVSVL